MIFGGSISGDLKTGERFKYIAWVSFPSEKTDMIIGGALYILNDECVKEIAWVLIPSM